jgi:hypothetical protein
VAKKIITVMRRDNVTPYSLGPFPFIPYVQKSNHPRFDAGTRLDYGFLTCALQDGYEVQIIPPSDSEIQGAIEEYERRNGRQDWISWRPESVAQR